MIMRFREATWDEFVSYFNCTHPGLTEEVVDEDYGYSWRQWECPDCEFYADSTIGASLEKQMEAWKDRLILQWKLRNLLVPYSP